MKHDIARAAIAALQSTDPMDPLFCSHGGSCEQNATDTGGAFCVNYPHSAAIAALQSTDHSAASKDGL